MASVTVVTINYNNFEGLRRTCESVRTQSALPYIHHVVVDGGSTDGAVEWLERYSGHPVSWTSEQDCGIYDALNKGTRIAERHSALVMWMNSGDKFGSSDTVAHVIESWVREQWRWAFGGVEQFGRDPATARIVRYTEGWSPRRFAVGATWVPHQSVAMSTELTRAIGEYPLDLDVVADQAFLLSAQRLAEPRVLDEVVSVCEAEGEHLRLGEWGRWWYWRAARRRAGIGAVANALAYDPWSVVVTSQRFLREALHKGRQRARRMSAHS